MNELDVLNQIGDIGYLLLRYGAEIYRVEESISRMMKGLGYQNVEVFALPAYLTMSCTLKNDRPYCMTRRSTHNRINLDKLYALNCLVRKISDQQIDVDKISDEIKRIKKEPLNYSLILLGYVLSAAFFTLFFGGGLNDVLVGGLNGFVLYYVILFFLINYLVKNFISKIISKIISKKYLNK